MRKRLLFVFTVFISISFAIFPKNLKARGNFATTANTEYKIHQSGKTTITNVISIKNLTSESFSKSYILNLNNLTPKNIKAFESGDKLEITETKKGDSTQLKVNFEEKVVGIGKTRTFVITYEENTFALQTGEVWEVSIPRLANPSSFNSYKVTLSIPKSFGDESYISPDPISTKKANETAIYTFNKDSLGDSGISAAFGKFQVFDFSLNYHLENPLNKRAEIEIAIPPDTSTQKIYLESIEPYPTNIFVDEDGNWLAKYLLKPRQKINVKVTGAVKIIAVPRKLLTPLPSTLLQNTKPTEFWQSDDLEIKTLANKLKTPENIYNYVVESLVYDVNRVKPKTERLGAKSALFNSSSALCTEFTDLFIALTRAAGIPAREINGFAYSENPEIQPLSLVADVLHAWPEYWSGEKGTWVPVDPTWASMANGVDYFNKLDLRHFAFVIHGKSSTEPIPPGSYKLGPEPQKDIHVNPSTLPPQENSNLEITYSSPLGLNLLSKKIKVRVANSGSTAVYNITPRVLLDGQVTKSNYLAVLPPGGTHEIETKITYGLFGSKTPDSIVVKAGKFEKNIPINKSRLVAYQAILLFVALLAILVLTYRYVHLNIRHSMK